MQENLQNKSEEYVKKNRKRNVWKRVVQILACVVVFCTTYALILPAITMEQKSYCGYEEHMHTQKCYREIPVASELMCPLVEGEVVENTVRTVSDGDGAALEESREIPQPHTHTEDCYAVPKEPPLTCTVAEGEEHTHDFLCYGSWELTCVKEEHTHDLSCFADKQADVESHSVWENMIANMDLTGIWAEDVVTIAKSQMGYTESARNYIVNEDTTVNGYTRYGAWGEDPYGDWDTMFASFCLHYAEVEDMPLGADCNIWIQELTAVNLYRVAAGWEPQPGNLLFTDENLDGVADHVAIVSEYIAATDGVAAQIKAVQGDVADQVQYVTYEMGDERIYGYGILPKQPDPVLTYTYSDDTLQVEVELPEGTRMPKDAVLVVKPIIAESEGYDQLLNQAEAAIDGMVEQIQFYDISFYTPKQEYIPVSDRAQVVMRFKDKVIDPTADTVVLHYDENDSTPVVLDHVSVDEQTSHIVFESGASGPIMEALERTPVELTNTVVSFATDGFSVFAVVEVESGKYKAQVPTDLTYLIGKIGQGKTYMIFNNANIYNESSRMALSAEVITVHKNNVAYNRLLGKEVVYDSNAMTVTSDADPTLLWHFAPIEDGYFSIYSEATGKYLSISQDGTLELSDTPYSFGSDAVPPDVWNNIRFRDQSNHYVAFYAPDSYDEYRPTFNTTTELGDYAHNGLIIAEYQGADISDGDPITNLDGKVMMIVAVNNNASENGTLYPAVALSTIPYEDKSLTTVPMNNIYEQNGKMVVNGEDVNNNLIWEFESTGEKGFYFIKCANLYGEPNNESQGQYLYFVHDAYDSNDSNYKRELRLGGAENKQPFEVVKGIVTNGNDVQEVVCLRSQANGLTGYLHLGGNNCTWPVFTSEHFDLETRNSLSERANHFILVELSDTEEEGAEVNRINDIIDQLPASLDEFNNLSNNDFDEQIKLYKKLREMAMEVKEYCDGKSLASTTLLSDTQKNFIGQKRIAKWDSLEWLWRENPQVVENDEILDATIKVFNYDEGVNDKPLAKLEENPFTFYDYTDENAGKKTVDGMGNNLGEYTVPNMASRLVNGYPYIEVEGVDGSLQYLFDENGQYHQGTMTDGGGLFQKDAEGYYYYYSDKNAAWYDDEENRFELYNVAIRPEFTRTKYNKDDSETAEARGNFYPFNKILNEDNNDVSNVIYDGSTVESILDKQKTQTAFLNDVTDLWFGMSIEYDFFIPEGSQVTTPSGEKQEMVFQFHGDDDVFVYIDDVLILDIGGTHTARSGSINFTTGEVLWQTGENEDGSPITESRKLATFFGGTAVDSGIDGDTLADYTMHNLKFFYMERGGTYSYAGIRFNMPALPEDALIIRKELTSDAPYIDAELDYTFRVVKADSTGNTVSEESFFKENIGFIKYSSVTGESTPATIKEDGTFTLKAGEVAIFDKVVELVDDNAKEFVVQEIFSDKVNGQYFVSYTEDTSEKISISEAPSGNQTHGVRDDVPASGFTAYQTNIYTIDKDESNFAQIITYTNDVDETKLDTLNVTKKVGENEYIDSNKQFGIQVMVGNDENQLIFLPQGTKYVLTNTTNSVSNECEVEANGIIRLKINETATIKGFLAGTYWEVEEKLEVDEHYTPMYSGTSEKGSIDTSGRAGYFGVGDTVQFTVTNYPCDFLLNVPISKQAIGNNGNATFRFDVERGSFDTTNGTWTSEEEKNGTTITVVDDTLVVGNITLGFKNSDPSTVYYKISEQKGDGEFIYDEKFYILEVNIEKSATENVARIGKVWKNGKNVVDNQQISFTNYKSTTLTVDKTVVHSAGVEDDTAFPFRVQIQLDGKEFKDIPSSTEYTVADGIISFDLKNGEKITIQVPVTATVTVTETNNSGYKTNYQVVKNGEIVDTQSGTKATVQNVVNEAEVHFTNQTGYELPATGGSGTHGYIWCGLLMILAAAGLLFYQRRAKRNN